jgi:transcription-repair coupling factor (superfamily II helicase)
VSDFLKMFGSEGSAAIVAAFIALVGVILSAIISSLIARKSNYITAVTTERSKWIDKLRNNLSQFAGSAAYLFHKMQTAANYATLPEHDELVQQLERLEALIRLQLNPFGAIDKNIITLVDKTARFADKQTDQKFLKAHSLLILHAQWLLKEEWETVKLESVGILRGLWYRGKRYWRRSLYQQFCQTQGSLASIDR